MPPRLLLPVLEILWSAFGPGKLNSHGKPRENVQESMRSPMLPTRGDKEGGRHGFVVMIIIHRKALLALVLFMTANKELYHGLFLSAWFELIIVKVASSVTK